MDNRSLSSVFRRRATIWASFSLGIACCLDTSAATMCVDAGQIVELQTALTTAASNNEDDVIKLQAGQYSIVSNFLLAFDPLAEHHDLTIEGGYGPNLGDPCGLPPAVPDASATVLDGGLLWINMGGGTSTGSLTLKGLTIKGMTSPSMATPPIAIFGGNSPDSDITIQNVEFSGNNSSGNVAIELSATQGALSVRDSLFVSNAALATGPIVFNVTQPTGTRCVEIVNSTFTNNAGGHTIISAHCPTVIANDIFWGNGSSDIYFVYPQNALLGNVDLGNPGDAVGTAASNILSVDPMFKAAETYYALADLSPLRDAGDPGGFFFVLDPYDVVGNTRIYGAKPDIGASEIQDVIFANGVDFQRPF